MTRDAESIFHAARTRPEPERKIYLDGACGNDVALRAKVEMLLNADAEAGSFMKSIEPPAQNGATIEDPKGERTGEQIGRYKLLQQIGEGGFGSVWMAEQREPVKRRVALKIIKLGMDTKQVIARFEAERQALAMMDHPNIAKVLDAGSTETGRPFFVMELVRGVPILEYCDTEKLDTKARLDLFINVCQAIQHAHQKGIIHRDIKPTNVLITLHDGVPVPKVIDFGIAKATNQELTDKTLFTQHRQMIGTPAYMSPEQAEMSGLDVDTRSDIYSLGVLLYELLTGTTPFATDELMSKGFAEMMRIIREVEPHKPSTRLSTLGETALRTAEQRHVADPKKLGMVLRGDLDWIVMKCLEKDRTRRYETANGLAADIGRHLNDEPVIAGPPGARYRLTKFMLRNRTAVGVAGGIAVIVLLALAVVTYALFQVGQERDRAWAAELQSRALRELVRGGQVSLAVLPLSNESDDPEYAYIASGVTTFLTNDLHRISALRLMSELSVRSAMQHPDSPMSLREIAKDLGVDGVVTGSVSQRGEDVTLKVRLIHALTNQNVWEREYSAKLGDLQRMENEVSRDIVEHLQLELTSEEQARLATAPSVHPDAEAACLKGYHVMQRWTHESLVQALEYFDQAIEIDPDYAAAHAAKAFAWVRMADDFSAPNDSMPHAKEAALTALKLDDTLAEARQAVGTVSLLYDWNWKDAEHQFKTAIEVDPDSPSGYIGYAVFLAAMNRPDESMDYLNTAVSMDPYAMLTFGDTILTASFMNRQYEWTVDHCMEAIGLNPNSSRFYAWLGLTLAQMGDLNGAVDAVDDAHRIVMQEFDRNPDSIPPHFVFAAIGGVHANAGNEEMARVALRKMEELGRIRYQCPYETATVLLALNEIDAAFAKFHEAIDLSSDCVPWLGVDPRLDGARAHERFSEFPERDERIRELLDRTGWHQPQSPGEQDGGG